MKKKFTFLAFVVLASCSDMAPSNEMEAVKHELPGDFNASDYMEINPDVMSSQLALLVKSNNDAVESFSQSNRAVDCREFLSDKEFAKKIYLDYLGCPEKGWDTEKSCEGQEAFTSGIGLNNAAYSKENSCNIRGCWAGGWEEPFWPPPPYSNIMECLMECELDSEEECQEYCIEQMSYDINKKPIVDIWDSLVPRYNVGQDDLPGRAVFSSLCVFNIWQEDKTPSLEKDKAFINAFTPDTSLVFRHFTMVGRYEGRPYKYCGDSDFDKLRVKEMSVLKTAISGNTPYPFDDYSINPATSNPQFFCLNNGDKKVYRIK